MKLFDLSQLVKPLSKVFSAFNTPALKIPGEYSLYITNIEREKDNGNTLNISIETEDLEIVRKICQYYKSLGFTIGMIKLRYKELNYENLDLSILSDLSKTTKIKIKLLYRDLNRLEYYYLDYEDVLAMASTISNTRNYIKSLHLSPLEIIMFAYDLLKEFEAKVNETESYSVDERDPARVLNTDFIVCIGYARLFGELVKDMPGIRVECISLQHQISSLQSEGHMRPLIRVDDEKYNVHGVYALDPTWDSTKTIYFSESEERTPVKSWLSLYVFFLIPLLEYRATFGNETSPQILEIYKNGNMQDYDFDRYFSQLFDRNDLNSLPAYIEAKRPTLETFSLLLENVRKVEGYSEQEIRSEVSKVIELNMLVIRRWNLLNSTRADFFTPESYRINI